MIIYELEFLKQESKWTPFTQANRTRLNRMNQSDAAGAKRGKKRVSESWFVRLFAVIGEKKSVK